MYLSLNGGVRDEQFFDFDIDYKRGLWKRDTYTNKVYMYVAQGTPFLYERAHSCRVYIHIM